MKSLPESTLATYRKAVYHIFGEPDIDMEIDAKDECLKTLLAQHGVRSAVFVTAFNPFGEMLDAGVNATRQQRLGAELERMNLRTLSGIGFDPDEAAPHSEASLLVLGASHAVADVLLQDFEQNAVVIVDESGVPQLLLHPKFR